MAERLMRQRPHHSVAHDAFGAALATPWIRLDHATLDHRPACLDPLPDSFETELVKSAERSEIRRGEGSVEHVEVFQMGSVGTSILEDLDPYPRTSERTPPTPSNAKSPLGPLIHRKQVQGGPFVHSRPPTRAPGDQRGTTENDPRT